MKYLFILFFMFSIILLQWSSIQLGRQKERLRFLRRWRSHFDGYVKDIGEKEGLEICRFAISVLDYCVKDEDGLQKYPKFWTTSFWKEMYSMPKISIVTNRRKSES